jgi:hypothetical protein
MSAPLQNMRETNRRMSDWLDSLSPKPGEPMVATPEQIGGILSELSRTGAWLRSEPLPTRTNDPELRAALNQYQKHVERLRDLLPFIHRQLLTERARLEAQRVQVHSVTEWARASRQTL